MENDSEMMSPVEKELDFFAMFYSRYSNMREFLSMAKDAGFLKFITEARARRIFERRLKQKGTLKDALGYTDIERLEGIFKAKGDMLYGKISKEAFAGLLKSNVIKSIIKHLSSEGLVEIRANRIKPAAKYAEWKTGKKIV